MDSTLLNVVLYNIFSGIIMLLKETSNYVGILKRIALFMLYLLFIRETYGTFKYAAPRVQFTSSHFASGIKGGGAKTTGGDKSKVSCRMYIAVQL